MAVVKSIASAIGVVPAVESLERPQAVPVLATIAADMTGAVPERPSVAAALRLPHQTMAAPKVEAVDPDSASTPQESAQVLPLTDGEEYHFRWRIALADAEHGRREHLADLVRTKPIPPEHRDRVAKMILHPPRRRPGKVPMVSFWDAMEAWRFYEVHMVPKKRGGKYGWNATYTLGAISRRLGVSPDAAKNVVHLREAYSKLFDV